MLDTTLLVKSLKNIQIHKKIKINLIRTCVIIPPLRSMLSSKFFIGFSAAVCFDILGAEQLDPPPYDLSIIKSQRLRKGLIFNNIPSPQIFDVIDRLLIATIGTSHLNITTTMLHFATDAGFQSITTLVERLCQFQALTFDVLNSNY